MRDARVVDALPNHVISLSERLREQDREEIWAAFHFTPYEALNMSYETSALRWTVLLDDLPIIMFGAAPIAVLGGGVPWMLASPEIEQIKYKFVRQSREYVQLMEGEFPHLENYVDARNTVSINWLKWCGFTVCPAAPFGIEQLPFHRFYKGGA